MSGIVAGKIAFVTGAGSGIGRAACHVLSREGATVIAADKNYNTAVATVTNLIVPVNCDSVSNHSAVEVDVANSTSVQNALKTVLNQYKTPPTIIVNSAGITRPNPLMEMSEEVYNSVLDINLKGTFLVMQAFVRELVAAGKAGSVVNISSVVANRAVLYQSQYSASKAGQIGLSQVAALELGKYNIRVNSVLPGGIDTPLLSFFMDENLPDILRMIPLGRYGKPEEVGELIAFLGSDKSSYISGASMSVSGAI